MPSPRTPEQMTLARKARIQTEAIRLLLNERLAQEEWGMTAEHDDKMTFAEWGDRLRMYAERVGRTDQAEVAFPYRLIEVGSLALAGLEAYFRKHPDQMEAVVGSKAVMG